MRKWLLCLPILLFLLPVVPARAGGSPIEMERTTYAPGEIARGHVNFGRGCCNRATPEDGPWFLYLWRYEEGKYPPPLPDDAVWVAELRIDEGGEYLYTGFIEFTVPDLEPGQYELLHCNDPCSNQLGDIMGASIGIVQDASKAEIRSEIDRFDRRLRNRLARYDALGYRLGAVERRFERKLARVDTDLRTQLDEIEARADRLEERTQGSDPIAGAALPALVIALGGALFLGRARRS